MDSWKLKWIGVKTNRIVLRVPLSDEGTVAAHEALRLSFEDPLGCRGSQGDQLLVAHGASWNGEHETFLT